MEQVLQLFFEPSGAEEDENNKATLRLCLHLN